MRVELLPEPGDAFLGLLNVSRQEYLPAKQFKQLF